MEGRLARMNYYSLSGKINARVSLNVGRKKKKLGTLMGGSFFLYINFPGVRSPERNFNNNKNNGETKWPLTYQKMIGCNILPALPSKSLVYYLFNFDLEILSAAKEGFAPS